MAVLSTDSEITASASSTISMKKCAPSAEQREPFSTRSAISRPTNLCDDRTRLSVDQQNEQHSNISSQNSHTSNSLNCSKNDVKFAKKAQNKIPYYVNEELEMERIRRRRRLRYETKLKNGRKYGRSSRCTYHEYKENNKRKNRSRSYERKVTNSRSCRSRSQSRNKDKYYRKYKRERSICSCEKNRKNNSLKSKQRTVYSRSRSRSLNSRRRMRHSCNVSRREKSICKSISHDQHKQIYCKCCYYKHCSFRCKSRSQNKKYNSDRSLEPIFLQIPTPLPPNVHIHIPFPMPLDYCYKHITNFEGMP